MVEFPARTIPDASPEEDDGWDAEMAWVEPKYKKSRVNWAGRMLLKQDSLSEADHAEMTAIINNWRSSHNFPLNTFQMGLRKRARQIDPTAITAQRIKRLASIGLKFERMPTMTLGQMQDIGGCRAILETIDQVDKLVQLYESGDLKHDLYEIDDYILFPKDSGYRGIHLKWKYKSNKNEKYNGLRIEMQLRSRLQHVWATAVEAVGTLLSVSLKSSQGDDDWLRFFALMSCAFSYREGTDRVPGCPGSYNALVKEIKKYARRLDVANRLNVYAGTLDELERMAKPTDHFFLLVLDAGQLNVRIRTFKLGESKKANDAYIIAEEEARKVRGRDVVLVSVDSLKSLRSAYPNYFLDTDIFRSLVDETVRSNRPPVEGKRAMPKQLQLL